MFMRNKSPKVLIVAKYYYDDSMLTSMINNLKKFSSLKLFFFNEKMRNRKLKQEVNDDFKRLITENKFDLIIVWNNILIDEEINLINSSTVKIGILNGFTCINSYFHEDQLKFFKYLKNYDYYFISQKKYIKKLRDYNINAIHFNFFSDPVQFKPLKINNIFNLGFIGNVDKKWALNRYKNLNHIQKTLDKKIMLVNGNNIKMKNIINFPKLRNDFLVNIFFNFNKINLSFDYLPSVEPYNHMKEMKVKYIEKFVCRVRNFNITLSKSLLLVEDHPEINSLFEKDKEIVTWSNSNDLTEKIDKILNDKIFLKQISEKGFKNTLNNHTVFHRLNQIQKETKIYFDNFDLKNLLFKYQI